MAALSTAVYTSGMQIPGRVSNGVVILEGSFSLPEGTHVVVTVPEVRRKAKDTPLPFPIVRSRHPGSVNLTNERIAELLEDEDLSSGR
jgi:hypothetical protein